MTADILDKDKMIPCENHEVDDKWDYKDNGQVYSKLNKKVK